MNFLKSPTGNMCAIAHINPQGNTYILQHSIVNRFHIQSLLLSNLKGYFSSCREGYPRIWSTGSEYAHNSRRSFSERNLRCALWEPIEAICIMGNIPSVSSMCHCQWWSEAILISVSTKKKKKTWRGTRDKKYIWFFWGAGIGNNGADWKNQLPTGRA
jgi:hypothetical protein